MMEIILTISPVESWNLPIKQQYYLADFLSIYGDLEILFKDKILLEERTTILIDVIGIINAINGCLLDTLSVQPVIIRSEHEFSIRYGKLFGNEYLFFESREGDLLQEMTISEASRLSDRLLSWLERFIKKHCSHMSSVLSDSIVRSEKT